MGLKVHLYDYATEHDPLLVAAAARRSVDLVYRFIEGAPVVDAPRRMALWQKLIEAHLLLDRIQVLVLGLEVEAANSKKDDRRSRQVAGGIEP